MKAIVKIRFIDKTTGKVRKVGEVFTCNKARFVEIKKAGDYIEEYKDEAKQPDEQ
jgi:hypothetical protein